MNKKIPVRKVQLCNKQGEYIEILLREYACGDEAGMISCIRDEYKETYFKRDFYHAEYLRKEAENGHIIFLVAEIHSIAGQPQKSMEIAGMMALKKDAGKRAVYEIASQIFKKKYRGYGMAETFFTYAMGILANFNCFSLYSLPVVFHNVTQRLLYRLGFKATGFLLNVFDMGDIVHSYHNGRNSKHSQGIQIYAVKKQDVGEIYIPGEHEEFCRQIYRKLGVQCHIMTEKNISRKTQFFPITGTLDTIQFLSASDISYRQNALQSSLEICIRHIGTDLLERIAACHKKYPLKGKQTINILLPLNTPYAIWAYKKLVEKGYFFSGLKPLGSEGEYMILHHPGEVQIFFEDYVLSEEFKEVTTYIQKQFKENRRKNDGN